jgi:hypothetical protein
MGEIRNAYNILVGRPEGKNHLEDLGVDRRMILEWIKEDVDWMHLAQDRDQWETYEHGMNLRGT